MPKGIYKRSTDQIKKLSESAIARNKAMVGRHSKLKGKCLSDKHKQNISLSKVGIKRKPFSADTLFKMSIVKTKKENETGIVAKHQWIKKIKGKANCCEICRKINKKNYQWSNKNHKYSKKESEWQMVCVSCHRTYDYTNNNLNTICVKGRKGEKGTKRVHKIKTL
jgi:hypothetical protein